MINTLAKSPAEVAGLQSGDEIIAVQSGLRTISGNAVTPDVISKLISESTNPVSITYERGTQVLKTVSIIPSTTIVSGKRAIGIGMDVVGTLKLSPFQAVIEGAKTTALLTRDTAIGLGLFLWHIVTFHSDFSQVAGPIGIAKSVGQAQTLGFTYLLSLIALISINLAVINILPFPALDGGRLFLILIEVIIRRPINPKIVQTVNAVGFVVLLILMVVISGHDIFKLL